VFIIELRPGSSPGPRLLLHRGQRRGAGRLGRTAGFAAPVPESCRDLAPKIARHGADEDKHGRIFNALLRKRGLQPVPVPAETDYTMRLERVGLGLTHSQLRHEEQLTERDIIAYLVHSRVTEQRASEQIAGAAEIRGSRQEISRAVKMIANDEVQPPHLLPRGAAQAGRVRARGHPSGARCVRLPSPRSPSTAT